MRDCYHDTALHRNVNATSPILNKTLHSRKIMHRDVYVNCALPARGLTEYGQSSAQPCVTPKLAQQSKRVLRLETITAHAV